MPSAELERLAEAGHLKRETPMRAMETCARFRSQAGMVRSEHVPVSGRAAVKSLRSGSECRILDLPLRLRNKWSGYYWGSFGSLFRFPR